MFLSCVGRKVPAIPPCAAVGVPGIPAHQNTWSRTQGCAFPFTEILLEQEGRDCKRAASQLPDLCRVFNYLLNRPSIIHDRNQAAQGLTRIPGTRDGLHEVTVSRTALHQSYWSYRTISPNWICPSQAMARTSISPK